jgi:hypothetical protein
VHITQQEAGAALCTSLLLQLLHGTNPKQRALLRTLSPCFQRDVSRAPIIGDFCLHKDSSRRSIASRAGADKVLGGGMFSRCGGLVRVDNVAPARRSYPYVIPPPVSKEKS